MTAKVQQSPMAKLPVVRLLEREDCGPTELAKRLGVHPRIVHRAQAGGGVHCWTADKWAIKLGWHPSEIWGALWWHLACDAQDWWDERLAAEKEVAEANNAWRRRLYGLFGEERTGKFCGRHPNWSARNEW